MSGRLISFTPAEVRGISTPVITQHLPTGAISYDANGELKQIGGYTNFGRGGKRRGYTKKTKRTKKNIRRLKRTKKINRHRREKKARKY